jgi:Rieske 2Fe-2S family protein
MTTVGLPASLISTLPGSYYTDATIFEMEQAAIFESCGFAPCDRPTSTSQEADRASRREAC